MSGTSSQNEMDVHAERLAREALSAITHSPSSQQDQRAVDAVKTAILRFYEERIRAVLV